jgi:hypothetical protein
MRKATIEAEQTIAVLSPDYLNPLYTQPEWAAALVQELTGADGKLPHLTKKSNCVIFFPFI